MFPSDQFEPVEFPQTGWLHCIECIERSGSESRSFAALTSKKANEHIHHNHVGRITLLGGMKGLEQLGGRLLFVPTPETNAGRSRYFDHSTESIDGDTRMDHNLFGPALGKLRIVTGLERLEPFHFQSGNRSAAVQVGQRSRKPAA